MPTSTTNYELIKPGTDDPILIEQINDNMDTIDTVLKDHSDKIDAAALGIKYKGEVNYYADLPNNAEIGDAYTVKYAGSSGTTPDGTEYVWGAVSGVNQWINFSKDSYSKAEVDALLALKQNALNSAQLAAVNSGINSAKVEQIETNKNNISTLDKEADALANNVRKNMINLLSFPIVTRGVTITQDLLTGELVFNGTASGTGYIYAYVGTIAIEAGKVYGFIDPMRGKTIDGALLYSYIGSPSLFSEEYPGFFNSRANRTAIADGKSSIVVRLSGGTTYSDCRLSPMIFDGEITDSTYQPPAETNAHLTQQLQYAQFRRITTNSSSVTFNLIRTDSTNRFRYGFVLLGDETNSPAIYAMLIGNENANPTVSFTKIGGGIEVTLTGSVVYDGYSVAVTITSTSTLYGGIRLIWLD